MFAIRTLQRRTLTALSSSKSFIWLNRNKPEDLIAPFERCGDFIGIRSMSSGKERSSMRSRVQKTMQKESGKTMTEIRRAKTFRKKLMTEEERLIFNLRRAKKKVALLLQKLKKYELPELPPPKHDPELFTPEQFQAFKKIGFRNKNYVPVGVRGVFGGVVQNMHMHWKFHETVQVCCDNFPKERIKEMASMLARLSGGIVINIHNVKTIIMFRGRNYRQPKNLIPINTLTKRKALFKARFEQALDSQKLNIKKYEQELRRKGVNPEDPVAMASIQRVASTFFNAIDKKDGSPYVFQGSKEQTESKSIFLEQPEQGDDSDQEELDKFIADIEDAADKEWEEEEAAEKEELGRIRYLNREHSGGRYVKYDMDSGGDYGDDRNQGRVQRDQRESQTYDRRRTSDIEISEDDSAEDSDDVRDGSDLESDSDNSSSVAHKFKKPMAGRRDSNNITGRRQEMRDVKAKKPLSLHEDSGTEDVLSDLENAMWKSDTELEEEHEPEQPKVRNNKYISDDEHEGDAYETRRDKNRNYSQPEQRNYGRNPGRTDINYGLKETNEIPGRVKNIRDQKSKISSSRQNFKYGGSSSESDIAMWESDDEEDLKVAKKDIRSHQSTCEEDEQSKGAANANKDANEAEQINKTRESD